MPRDSEDRHHRSSKSRRRSSTDKNKAEHGSSRRRTDHAQQRAQHKSSPEKSGSRSNRHNYDDDRIVVDGEHRRDERHHHRRRHRRRHSKEGDTRRRDSTTKRSEEHDHQGRRRRKKHQSSHHENTHDSHYSDSSGESDDDSSSSSASSVSSLSDHFHRHQDKRQRQDIIPKGGDEEGSLDSAYIYLADGDEREGEKIDDEDTNRRHHRDHHRSHRSRRKSHGHRKDSDHRRRRSSATTTLDSTRSPDVEGRGAETATPATSITAEGKDIAQEIADRRHLELELIDVREQLARALADKMRLERKAAKLDKTTKLLHQENQDLKNMLADPIMNSGSGNGTSMVPSSTIHVHEGDVQHEVHIEKKPSSTKQLADGHGSSLSSAAFDMLHASEEAKLQMQKAQRRHTVTSAGTSSFIQQGEQLLGAEQQQQGSSNISEIPLSVLKAPPPEYYDLSPSSGGKRNRARLLSRSQSSRGPPVANIVTVDRQRSSEGTKSSSERCLRLEKDDTQNGHDREDNSMTKKAHAMMKKAVSERLLFRRVGPPGST